MQVLLVVGPHASLQAEQSLEVPSVVSQPVLSSLSQLS